MDPEKRLISLGTLMVLFVPFCGSTRYLYFSNFSHCDQTYTVSRDEVLQIEGKRSSDDGTSPYTDCSLLFRAGKLEDKLCMKISTLTFNSSKLQLQYFKSLDPSIGNPFLTYDSSNAASTPKEFCDNEHEISMKLHALNASAKLNEVTIVTEVYSMQGTQRIAYMDTDCEMTYNLSKSTIRVENTDPNGPNSHQSVCQLYFNYVGGYPDYSVCVKYQKTKDTCGYELKVYDGPVTGTTLAHTYTCSNEQPQQWCGTGASIYLELIVSGTDPLPVGVFTVEVKDAKKDIPIPREPTGNDGLPSGTLMIIAVAFLGPANVAVVAVVVVIRKKRSRCRKIRPDSPLKDVRWSYQKY